MGLQPGDTFGSYEVIGPLGRGGMATVYRCYEPALDRHVALKVLPAEFLHDATFSERFRREAKVIARLEHPNIVPIHAFGIEGNIPWMAMRLISGGSVLIQRYVRRRFPALTREEHNDVTKFTYGFIGFLYAFFIGFLVSAMWGQINTADSNARAEGAAAVQMATDAGAFDPADGDRIRQSLLAYEQAILAEWGRNDTSRSAEADTALAGVYTAYGQVPANTDTQKTRLATSYSNLDKVSQARTVRILAAREDTGPRGRSGSSSF